ncbi:hypothetical protein AVEN_125019-1 [Araneus ventricosus]|uniref:Uncharacterized protein n=1 Tax=Araneus ventricosus TaxID=182803 RepID=A0A4Y2GXB4_ARAVE|nr:hypothetical protein AVEN_125019-1 [Araneus ventricosus]
MLFPCAFIAHPESILYCIWYIKSILLNFPDNTNRGQPQISSDSTNLLNPAWLISRPCPLSQFSAAVFTSLFEENLFPDKCMEPRLGAKSGLYGWLQTSHLNIRSNFWVLGTVWVL